MARPLALLLALTLAAPVAFGQAGTLDPSFGGDGFVTQSAGLSSSSRANAVVALPDGGTLVGGDAGSIYTSGTRFALTRLDADGRRDPAFGDGGAVTVASDGSATLYDLALQPDGKIVAVGVTTRAGVNVFTLARFMPDGAPDSTFGAAGIVTADFGNEDAEAGAVAVQPDGRLVVAGRAGGLFVVSRYEPDGTSDPAFGTGGRVALDLSSGFDIARSLALDGDGRIVAVGIAWMGSRYGFCVVRLLSDGSLDPAFGTGGVTVVSFSSLNYVGAVALQPDGKIVVVGTTTYTNGKRNVTVVRYLPDGALDPSFGDAGRVTVSFSGSTEGRGVLLQPDGRIVVSGGGTAGTMGPFLLARLLPDGTPDLTFGPGGQRTPLGGTTAADLALLPDGRIVAAGTSSNAFAVVRLQESGITDASFGSGGVARIPGFFSGDSTVNGVAVDAEGRVVVAGCASGESGRTVYLTRFKADGTPDPSFDGRGAVDPAAATSDCAYGVAVQPDGRVVVAGWGTAGSSRRIAVARFLTNGTLDPSFGSGGRLFFLPVGQTSFTVLALALQADGRIVLAGCNANDQLGLVRLLPDGTLDPAFGAGGLAAVGEGCARALAIQPDGRIVAAGAVTYRIPGDPSDAYYKGRLVRVLSSGAPDPSFGTTGGVTADLSATAAFNAVALQADGRIVVGGSTGSMILGPYFFALARYEADGTRDLTFGGSGTVQPFSSGSAATGLAALPDGRLLAAGAASGFAFVRTLSDGTLDPTFDGDGRVTTAAGAGASALTLLPDGRFVAAGTARTLFGYDVAAARYLGDGVTPAEPGSAPTALTLTAAPNPVRGTAAVRYGLPAGAAVRLALYDALGREVAVLADGVQAAGTHEAALDAAALAPGVYVLRLAAGADARVMRVSVVR